MSLMKVHVRIYIEGENIKKFLDSKNEFGASYFIDHSALAFTLLKLGFAKTRFGKTSLW